MWSISCPHGETVEVSNIKDWCDQNGYDFFSVWSNRDGFTVDRIPEDRAHPKVEGYIHITDRDNGEVLASKYNAVHYENFADTIALALMDFPEGHIHEMVFGNGASTVSGVGAITYLPPNVVGADARLYNETYSKIVDNRSSLMDAKQAATNNIVKKHISGNQYTDIIVTCTLDNGEPSEQDAFDDTVNPDGQYVFDELGLRSFKGSTSGGLLLTHVIFHPIQKSLNRVIEIVYTLRIYMS